MAENKTRLVVYDWLRLIATIWVVIGHSAYISMTTTYGGVSYTLPENLSATYNGGILTFCRNLTSYAYSFHMPLFFMLSGAVLALKPLASFDKFVKSKIKRLIIPYYIYGLLFMFPIKYFANFYDKDGLKQAVTVFLNGGDSGHLWFLPALFWCMIIFVVIKKIIAKKTDSVYLPLLISGLISLTYTNLPIDVLQLKIGLSYIFWFALGYTFENERRKNESWNFRTTLVLYAIFTMIEIIVFRCNILNVFFLNLCGSFQTYLLVDILTRIFKKIPVTKAWEIANRNLFYIYLFHDPLEYIVLKIFFSNNLLVYNWGCYLYVFSRSIGVFLASLVLGELVTLVKKGTSYILNYELKYKKARI